MFSKKNPILGANVISLEAARARRQESGERRSYNSRVLAENLHYYRPLEAQAMIEHESFQAEAEFADRPLLRIMAGIFLAVAMLLAAIVYFGFISFLTTRLTEGVQHHFLMPTKAGLAPSIGLNLDTSALEDAVNPLSKSAISLQSGMTLSVPELNSGESKAATSDSHHKKH